MTTSPSSDLQLCELLASKCGKIDSILKNGTAKDVTRLLEEIPTSSETFELVARFCQGFDVIMTSDNVVPLTCLAHFLDMSESRCRNNLLRRAFLFLEHRVLPSWNDAVRAFRSADSETLIHLAAEVGILSALADSLVSKSLSDPRLVGDPPPTAGNSEEEEGEGEEEEDSDGLRFHRPSTRRRLFALDHWPKPHESLTTLPLRLYEPLLREMARRGVPARHVAASLSDYARKWAVTPSSSSSSSSLSSSSYCSSYQRNCRREIVEAVERLLPESDVTCRVLSGLLRSANELEASSDCRNGLEFRIGRDLHRIGTVKDLLLIISRTSGSYYIEPLRRVLKQFYGSYSGPNTSGLERVAEMVEDALAEIAGDEGLGKEAFAELAEISAEVSKGTRRSSDGVYKGVDVYLDNHRFLSEAEREEVCRAVEVAGLSEAALDHAAKNERLPARVVLRVLFVVQTRLRESIAAEGEEEEEEPPGEVVEGMGRRLVELERECGAMRKEMDGRGGGRRAVAVKRLIGNGSNSNKNNHNKVSLWKEVKRKFGCIGIGSASDCNCHQVKRKRRN